MYDRCPLSADQSATAQNILLCVQHGGRTDRNPGAHIGREDQRSFATRLAYAVSRRFGRSVGAWDPA